MAGLTRATSEVSVPAGRAGSVLRPASEAASDRDWAAASLNGAMAPSRSPASSAPTAC